MNSFKNIYKGGIKEKKEAMNEKLKEILKKISEKLNQQFQSEMESEKTGNLLNEECRINIKAFQEGRRQGPYSEQEILDDLNKVRNKKINEFNIDASNPNVIEYYKSKGAKNQQDIQDIFQHDKDLSNWSIHEMAVTAVLYKFLPKDYVAVRSSQYDDYENGIDNLIINKKTGEVICTIDDFSAFKGSDRDIEKRARILTKAKQGGTNARYGITYKDGKLIKKNIKNIPAFNLRLSSEDVNKLVDAMEKGEIIKYTEEEKNILLKIINDFTDQIDFIMTNNLNSDIKEKINNFKDMLNKWSEIL